MRVLICGFCFLNLIVASTNIHSDELKSAEDMAPIKGGLMHAFVLEFAKMNPYLGSEKGFTSVAGQKTE